MHTVPCPGVKHSETKNHGIMRQSDLLRSIANSRLLVMAVVVLLVAFQGLAFRRMNGLQRNENVDKAYKLGEANKQKNIYNGNVQKNETLPSKFQPQMNISVSDVEVAHNVSILKPLFIEPTFSDASEILGIFHDLEHETILLKLNGEGKCNDPDLRARLSGPALTMIEWTRVISGKEVWMQGTYRLPFSGTYYLEILVMLCQRFNYHTNFTNRCLYDPDHNRITAKGTQITVLHPDLHNNSRTEVDFFWVQKENYATVPMYTRYQPQNCRLASSNQASNCKIATEFTRFDPYTEWFSKGSIKDIYVNIVKAQRHHTLCYVGSSHSQNLDWKTTKNFPNITTFQSNSRGPSYARWPRSVTQEKLLSLINEKNCSEIIIGIGQWPPSNAVIQSKHINKIGEPYSFIKYEHTMKEMLERVQSIDAGQVRFFLRSVHYNPLGDFIGACKPKDWRSPPVIDGYNDILRRITTKLKIPFLDTNHIIGPMWDSARDWCHYRSEAGTAEALYIAGKVYDVL